MNLRTLFLHRPTAPPSRRQLVIGCVFLVLLGAVVIVHAIAMTVFLWAVAARPKGVVMLTLLWVISAVAIFFIARGLRDYLKDLDLSSLPSAAPR